MKRRTAFTLIELSIVIVIVGLLIAGVAQTSKMVRTAKVTAARSATKQSVVNEMPGLALWLETTLPESIFIPTDNTIVNYDGNTNIWPYDINPQATIKSNATTSFSVSGNATQKPAYTENAINGLPAYYCNGLSSFMVDYPSTYFPPTSPYVINSFTIFLVASATTTHEIDTQANNTTTGTSGQKYVIGSVYSGGYGASSTVAGVGVSMGTNGVSVYEHANYYMPPLAVYNGTSSGLLGRPAIITVDYNNKTPTLYINSTNSVTGLISTMTTVVAPIQFCADASYGGFTGYIGEIIIFNRHLTAGERQRVEKYLGKKWGISF